MDYNKKIAGLESLVDHLKTELSYLNKILVKCGFPEGIETLKMTVAELLSETEVQKERA
ncbi:MAG: hypothetical protein V4487_07615 [Chlamydiota bacterium]